MFALIAAVFFFLKAFHVKVDDIDLLYVGVGFLAMHWAYSIALPVFSTRRQQQ